MNAIDKRIQELYEYMPDLTTPADLDQFWERSLMASRQHSHSISKEKVETPFEMMDTYAVTYRGYDTTPIHGWYLVPSFLKKEKYPAIVIYHGYQASRSLPEYYTHWIMMGVAVFVVDCRGQSGDTGNHIVQDGGMVKGWMTQNIADKENSYYKAMIIDAVRAVDWLSDQAEIDATNIGVMGGSQGGGLSLMTTVLHEEVAYCIANVPSLCHLDYGVLHSTGSLTEVATYLNKYPSQLDAVLDTLSYFDVMNMAHLIRVPVMMSVGLKDTICMPETIFAAYNRITAPKEMHVYPFCGHAVLEEQGRKMLHYVKDRINS